MKIKNTVLILSIAINVLFVAYLYLKANHITGVYSSLSSAVQTDLVQLEGAIEYQMANEWKEEYYVIEKLDDVIESIHSLFRTGKDMGVISKSQEDDLWKLYRYLLAYPQHSGFPNNQLTDQEINELIQLKDNLNAAGWEMNKGFVGSWESFSDKINVLVK